MTLPLRSISLLASAIGVAVSFADPLRLAPAQAQNPVPRDACAEVVQAEGTMTRPELRQFLQVPRGAARAEVTAALGEPYCRLESIEVELPDGSLATVERDAYPFDFAPQTWVVVFYSGDRYLTFEYSFPQSRSN